MATLAKRTASGSGSKPSVLRPNPPVNRTVGATQNGMEVLELAKRRGLRTILITRYPKSPLAAVADVVLCCGSSESPFQFGSVPAKVAQLVLLDVLFQEYLHRNREKCEENLQRIGAALSEKHV